MDVTFVERNLPPIIWQMKEIGQLSGKFLGGKSSRAWQPPGNYPATFLATGKFPATFQTQAFGERRVARKVVPSMNPRFIIWGVVTNFRDLVKIARFAQSPNFLTLLSLRASLSRQIS